MPRVVMIVLCLVLAALAGCAKTVHVIDQRGAPVQGAKVTAVGLSINSVKNTTDENGDAPLPGNIQGTKWVWIEKPGYKTFWINVPETWPLHVTLVPEQPDASK